MFMKNERMSEELTILSFVPSLLELANESRQEVGTENPNAGKFKRISVGWDLDQVQTVAVLLVLVSLLGVRK